MRQNVETREDFSEILTPARTERERNPYLEAAQRLDTNEELADFLRGGRERLLARVRRAADDSDHDPPGGIAAARLFSDLMDAVTARLFRLACEQAGQRADTLPMAIVATGGYGRRELCPFSDIDLTFVVPRDNDPHTDPVVRRLFSLVMDVCIARCKLEVGYAYRLLDDCAALDHQTACGLLDARLVAGNERLFIQFEDAFWMGLNPAEFIFAKLDERRKSLARWGTLPRVVEPQLKEGPGGLRDLQTLVWVVQARHQVDASSVRGVRAARALVREGRLTPEEAVGLAEAKEFLFRVRNALHAATNAGRDALVVTRQEEVAALLGYEDGPDAPAVERFMADLYPYLGLVRRLSEAGTRRVEGSRLFLGLGLDSRRRRIVPANDLLDTDDPVWLLWAFEMAQKYDLELSAKLMRRALDLAALRPVLADPAQAAEVFTRILSRRGKVYPALQTMADLGILGWFLPEFDGLMDAIPYDPSHDFTVGQHTLLVLRNLDGLLADTADEERAEMRRAFEELPHPEQLTLAALMHDAGKAVPGRPHSETGEELAGAVCRRLNWNEEAAANVKFLVRQHLVMAETSRLRDLNLDETLRDFTSTVSDLDRLNMLYLLTYADTSAVGAGVWTPVKGRFLRDLWRKAGALLTSEESPADDATLVRARRRLLKDQSLASLPEDEVAEHVAAMPPHYLLNTPPDRIALDIEQVRRVRAGNFVVEFQDRRGADDTELTVAAPDAPGLLARIARALVAAELDVHGAQVLTRVSPRDRVALDTLWVDYRGRPLSKGKRKEVDACLRRVLTDDASLEELLRARPSYAKRKTVPAAFAVRGVRNDLSDTLTVVETASPDLGTALYRGAEALAGLGWGIHSARVSPFGGEALANFYVEGARGLTEAAVREKLEAVAK